MDQWQTITYAAGTAPYVLSIVPGVALNEQKWFNMQMLEPSEYRLAKHEVRLREGFIVQPYDRDGRAMVLLDGNQRAPQDVFALQDNMGLALMGRLYGWKICTVEIEHTSCRLSFYNILNDSYYSLLLGTYPKGQLPSSAVVRHTDEVCWTPPMGLSVMSARDITSPLVEVMTSRETGIVNIRERHDGYPDGGGREIEIDGSNNMTVHETVASMIYENFCGQN